MTKKIVLIGGPGTGKSTTAAEIFVAFKKMGRNVELVPEWVRRDIAINGPMESVWEQYRTLENHEEAEGNFPEQVEYLIIDSGCLTPYFYAALYSDKRNSRDRIVVQDMHRDLLDALYKKRYDHIFFLPRFRTDQLGISFQDGVRYQTEEDINVLETYMTLFFTKIHPIDNIIMLDCPLKDRVETVIRTVKGENAVSDWKKALERDNGQ
jgi:hypothetical protein